MVPAVRFEGVTKRYPRGGPRYASLRLELVDGFHRAVRRIRGDRPEPRGTLALDDVSFEVSEGESFALIGPNGAGKSTALKLISRISYPTSGRVRVRGRVGALIEVGSGVHPELTARENIWLYGQILGMSKADIRRRFDEIVEFAELSHVLDTPVKLYSSGMQLRLGFAIASHLDPEVFVVDEALAVGDAGFQAKCVERMTKLVAEGRTLLFVSHNLFVVEAICRRALLLTEGRVVDEGPSSAIVRRYLADVDERRVAAGERRTYRSAPHVAVRAVTCHDASGSERYAFRSGEAVEIRLHLALQVPLVRPIVSFGLTDGRPGVLALASMQVDGNVPDVLENDCVVACRLKNLPFLPGVYEVIGSVIAEHGWGELVDWQPLVSFRIVDPPERDWQGRAVASHLAFAPLLIDYEWDWGPEHDDHAPLGEVSP